MLPSCSPAAIRSPSRPPDSAPSRTPASSSPSANHTTLSPALSVASGTQEVTVSGGAPLINLDSPDFASNMTAEVINNLPINGRRWSDLTLLTPGVVADSNGFGLLSFRHQSAAQQRQVDGADDNQAYFSEERGRTREGYSTRYSPSRNSRSIRASTPPNRPRRSAASSTRSPKAAPTSSTGSCTSTTATTPGAPPTLYQADYLRPAPPHNHHPLQAQRQPQPVGLRRRRPDYQGQALLVRFLRSIQTELPQVPPSHTTPDHFSPPPMRRCPCNLATGAWSCAERHLAWRERLTPTRSRLAGLPSPGAARSHSTYTAAVTLYNTELHAISTILDPVFAPATKPLTRPRSTGSSTPSNT